MGTVWRGGLVVWAGGPVPMLTARWSGRVDLGQQYCGALCRGGWASEPRAEHVRESLGRADQPIKCLRPERRIAHCQWRPSVDTRCGRVPPRQIIEPKLALDHLAIADEVRETAGVIAGVRSGRFGEEREFAFDPAVL